MAAGVAGTGEGFALLVTDGRTGKLAVGTSLLGYSVESDLILAI